MSRRMAEWGRRERSRLIVVLGGQCAACQTRVDLEFDCMEPTGHNHHRMNTSSRICFYRKQMKQGNVQLLCRRCNHLKGDMPLAAWELWLITRREKLIHSSIIMPCEQVQQLSSELARKNFDKANL